MVSHNVQMSYTQDGAYGMSYTKFSALERFLKQRELAVSTYLESRRPYFMVVSTLCYAYTLKTLTASDKHN